MWTYSKAMGEEKATEEEQKESEKEEMTERERLKELISQVQYMGGLECKLADHLLSNGVIVPPCKVGDKIYWYNMGGEIVEADVRKIMYAARHPHGFEYDIGFEDFGKTVFLTKEEAEKALKERSEGK